MDRKEYSHEEWMSMAESLYGKNMLNWKFKCPSCGYIASVEDYKKVKAPEAAIAFSCIGRYIKDCNNEVGDKKQPCNYAGGGLFKLNPVRVHYDDGRFEDMFDFADN